MSAGVKCRDAQHATCEKEAVCSGTSAECPPSPHMADGTPCLERGQCHDGKCIPYCETQGLQSCMCDISKYKSMFWTDYVQFYEIYNYIYFFSWRSL